MRKTGKLGVTVFAVIFIIGLSGTFRNVIAADPIKVGVVLSLTGWAGFLGEPEKEALFIKLEQIEREGGVLGRPFEIIIEELVSYEGLYCDLVEKGEKVLAFGKLEKVIYKNKDAFRVLIGSIDAHSKDYIVPL